MKRILSALLAAPLIVSLAACAAKTAATPEPTPAPTQAPVKTVETAPTPAPEPEPYAPMGIFSQEFNPFGMEWPDNLTVFQAYFGKGAAKLEGKNPFVLSMTGSGNLFAVVAYQADVAGLGLDDDAKFGLLEEYAANDGFLEFTGADGRIVTIRQANPNDDRYEYVESDGSHGISGPGCVIELTYYVPAAELEKYTQLVRDNYSMEALAPISDSFDTNTDYAECGITVSVYKDLARACVVYYLPDVETVMRDLQANGDGNWWEWNGLTQAAFMYDGVDSKLTFDTAGGAITVEQLHAELSVPPAAEGSLAALGFGFDDAGTCGVYEQRDPHYISVAIARPEWGEHPGEWNIEFMDSDYNGYSLRITYHASEGKYHISVDNNGESGAYDYYPATDEKGWEYPDIETVHRMFNDAFGTKEKELYYAPLEYLERYVQERFGMSVEELYALPAR